MIYTNEKSWINLSYKELSSFGYKGGRNVVGALPWQLDYLVAATKSKDKTIRKYKSSVSDFMQEQSDRIMVRYKDYFGIKADNFPLDDTTYIVNYLVPNAEDKLLTESTNALHTSGIQKGVDDVSSLSAVAIDSSLSNAKVALEIYGLGEKISRVNSSTRKLINNIVLRGIANGDGVVKIGQAIRTSGIDEYYQGRAFNIARTETRLAYDAGGKISYNYLGVNKFDVVGCVGTLAGSNELGLTASYGSFDEPMGSCGVLNVDMKLWESVSSIHHPSHMGSQVASVRS